MSNEPERHDRGRLQHDAEHARPRKKVSVVAYLAILFAAAFLLLLLSYFMQQRSSEETISGLKDSVSAMQSIENLMSDNESLRKQVAEQEEQLLQAKQTQAELTTTYTTAQKQLEAMDYLRRIQQFYGAKANRSARVVIEKFEAVGLKPYLPTGAVYQNEEQTVLSPAEEYQKIYDALY